MDLLLAALRAAPRRYRMPPLPADAAAAHAAGTDTALAFAIEAARRGRQHGRAPGAEVQALFTGSLAQLIREALAPDGGDPAFRALVLRVHDAQVQEHVKLSQQLAADRRAVRSAVDAVAHPGKLTTVSPGMLRDALARLHELAALAAWRDLRRAIEHLLAQGHAPGDLQPTLRAVLAGSALAQLVRGSDLLELDAVRRYIALCEQRGPLAGTDEAAAQGRAAARTGKVAEHATVQAFRSMVALLDTHAPEPPYRVVRSLRTPPGFPGEPGKAKDEWDAAIVRGDAIVLLAEVKAAPAAATPDFSRLQRGLQRLAHASADESYAFPSGDGEVRIAGASLRRLQPHGRTLPPHVIYCCTAAADPEPQVLNAASKAVLSAESASLAFAHELVQGGAPAADELLPVWEALLTAPRLRSPLHQYETACAARAAMLHPRDLLEALAAVT